MIDAVGMPIDAVATGMAAPAAPRPVPALAEPGFDAMLAAAAGIAVAGVVMAAFPPRGDGAAAASVATGGTDPAAAAQLTLARAVAARWQGPVATLGLAPPWDEGAVAGGDGSDGQAPAGLLGAGTDLLAEVAGEGADGAETAPGLRTAAAGRGTGEAAAPVGAPASPALGSGASARDAVAGAPASWDPGSAPPGGGARREGAVAVAGEAAARDRPAPDVDGAGGVRADGRPSPASPPVPERLGVARGPLDDHLPGSPVARGPVERSELPTRDAWPTARAPEARGVARGALETHVPGQPVARGPVAPDEVLRPRPAVGAPGAPEAAPPAPVEGAVATVAPERGTPVATEEGARVPVPDLAGTLAEAVRHAHRRADEAHRVVVRLDPPELGTVQVDVLVRGEDVHLALRADPGATGPLRDARDLIERALRGEGFSLGGFDVSARDEGQSRRPTPRPVAARVAPWSQPRGHGEEGLRL